METDMAVRSASTSPTLRSLSPSHEDPLPQVSLNEMAVEEQLKVKFLGGSIPTRNSVNELVRKKLSQISKSSLKKSKVSLAKINDVKKRVKKTVQMNFTVETAVEITDSDEYSDEEEEEEEPVHSRKTETRSRSWARRPSINPALLDLSSSSEESSSSGMSLNIIRSLPLPTLFLTLFTPFH